MDDPSRPQPYFLRSQRLGFRLWCEDDLPLAMGLWGDPEVTKFIDVRGKLSEEQVRELLSKHIAFQRQQGVQYWPVFLLADGRHAGCCGLRPYGAAHRVYELGVAYPFELLEAGAGWRSRCRGDSLCLQHARRRSAFCRTQPEQPGVGTLAEEARLRVHAPRILRAHRSRTCLVHPQTGRVAVGRSGWR